MSNCIKTYGNTYNSHLRCVTNQHNLVNWAHLPQPEEIAPRIFQTGNIVVESKALPVEKITTKRETTRGKPIGRKITYEFDPNKRIRTQSYAYLVASGRMNKSQQKEAETKLLLDSAWMEKLKQELLGRKKTQ